MRMAQPDKVENRYSNEDGIYAVGSKGLGDLKLKYTEGGEVSI